MPTRDFSAVAGGRRLRIALDVYKPDVRQFRHVKGVGARITVRNTEEQRRLWRAIEKTIERGDWRLDAAGTAADADRTGADRETGA
jgi:hypothetical protein